MTKIGPWKGQQTRVLTGLPSYSFGREGIDATGVGTPVVDVLSEAQVPARLVAVYFTHGDRRTVDRGAPAPTSGRSSHPPGGPMNANAQLPDQFDLILQAEVGGAAVSGQSRRDRHRDCAR